MGFGVVDFTLLNVNKPIGNKHRSCNARLDDSVDRKGSSVVAES